MSKKTNKTNLSNSKSRLPAMINLPNRRAIKFSAKTIRYSNFYNLSSRTKKYLLTIGLGIVDAIFTLLFVEITGLYSGGFAAFCQGLSRFFFVLLNKKIPNAANQGWIKYIYNAMFWFLYLLINFVIVTVLWKKMSKETIKLSIVFVFTVQIVGFSLSMIPGYESFLLFGSTSTVNEYLRSFDVQSIIYVPNVWPMKMPNNVDFNWEILISNKDNVDFNVIDLVLSQNLLKSFLLLIYATLFAFVTSSSNAALFIIGGTSGGTELCALYISEKTNKNVSLFLRGFQTTALIIATIFGSYLSGIVVYSDTQYTKLFTSWHYLINANLCSSLLWALLNSVLLNKLYPFHALVRVEIFTTKCHEILTYLKKENYSQPSTIVKSTGGYSHIENSILVTVLPLFEMPSFINLIRNKDKASLISITRLYSCDGNISLKLHS